MSKELKKYRLRATKKPAKNELLSSVVVVRNEQGEQGHCYVNFDAALVEAVGKKLPRGLMTQDPAHLIVVYYERTKVWLVSAAYVTGDHEVLLWKTEQKPAWLNFYRNKPHASPSSQAPCS